MKIIEADIKNKNAEGFIKKMAIVLDPNVYMPPVVTVGRCTEAVIMAEQEARERAKTAFCKSCQSKDCYEEGECDWVADFLKHYDKD